MSIITLLTDFGTESEYAGLMKGVILSINPAATIVDITHQIDSQDIVQAAFTVKSTVRFFPDKTVHLVVVDPGVGTERALIALEMCNQFFVAPDNGVLTLLTDSKEVASIVRITNSNFFLTPVSRTFHGRDIIAPVGAHISRGVEIKALGEEIDASQVVCMDGLYARISGKGDLTGRIVAVDGFGNLITNIEAVQLADLGDAGHGPTLQVEIGGQVISGLSETYGNVPSETTLALIGSRGYLEVAVRGGNAGRSLNAKKGDVVCVSVRKA